MTELSTRPRTPRRRRDDAARERRPARHRPRALHRRPGQPAPRRPARLSGAGPAHPRPGDGAADRAGAAGARRGPGAHRGRRARGERRRGQARRAAVPERGDVRGPRRVLGARRVAGGGPARRAGRRGRLRAAAVAGHGRRGDRGGELPGRPAARCGAATRRRRGPAARTSSRASSSSPARSTSTWRPTPRSPRSTRTGRCSSSRSTQHPSETQEIIAHVLGLTNSEVTVQCLRMGGGFGGKEMQPHGYAAIAALGARLTGRPGAVAAEPHAGHDDDGQAARVPLARGRSGSTPTAGSRRSTATLTADGGWSLDLSEPVQARALCHIDNAYWIPNIEVHGRIAKTNKTSQTAFRGFGGPQGMLVIENILGRCAPALGISARELRRRNFYRPGQTTPYGQPVRHPERLERVWTQVVETGDVDRRLVEIEAFNADARAHQAGAGDHPGEVRDLVQPDGVQPGGRAGARLQGRLGADQPRRHRDGPGPAHEDAAGGGDGARACRCRRCGSRRPGPTRCPTPRPPRRARVPTSTAAR